MWSRPSLASHYWTRDLANRRSSQFVQERLRVLQVGIVEALGEPAVDRGEEITSRGSLASGLLETRQGYCHPELQRFDFLMARGAEGARKGLLRRRTITITLCQHELPPQTMQFRLPPRPSVAFHDIERRTDIFPDCQLRENRINIDCASTDNWGYGSMTG